MRGRVVGAVVGVLVLAGCSPGEPAGTVTVGASPPVTESSADVSPPEVIADASVAPSPEPSVVPPPMPDAAREQTPEGAVAFTYWWFDLYEYALLTGDVDLFREVSPEGCGTCDTLISDINAVYGRMSSLQGGEAVLNSVSAPDGQLDPKRIQVVVNFDQAAADEITASGEIVPYFLAEENVSLTMLAYWDAGWVAAGVPSNDE